MTPDEAADEGAGETVERTVAAETNGTVDMAGAVETDATTADAGRVHTGRRRNEAARRAILEAAVRMLAEVGYEGFAIERLAKEAGVGKQTVYRWWPSKAAVIAEAVGARAQRTIPLPDTGDLLTDLTEFFTTSFAQAEDGTVLAQLRQMMAAALQDAQAAESLGAFVAGRRHELRTLLERDVERGGGVRSDADLDFLTDLAYGLLWYRGLFGHRPLDADAARKLAASIVAAGGASQAPA
jgi:AcrR family transcriptional regulator